MKNNLHAFLLLILAVILTVSSCDKRIKESKFLLNTIVDVTVVSKHDAQNAIDIAFKAISDVNDLMSLYNENSEVVKINKSAGNSAVKVSSDTFEVINRSLEFSKLTNGAFDVSVGPLVDIWGFSQGKNHIPTEKELQEKLSFVDYRNIVLDRGNSTVYLTKSGMKIDLGAIAIGYTVDKAIEALKEAGIKNALINAGGEIYALGAPPKKKAWRIGIQHPRRKNDLLGTLDLKDMAVSTSGDYENYFEANGKRYCHIINPKTGMPVEGVMSVTVVTNNTTDADALSTSLMLMKPDEAMKLAKSLKDVECVIVTGMSEKDMRILISSGLKDKVNLISDHK